MINVRNQRMTKQNKLTRFVDKETKIKLQLLQIQLYVQ